MTLIPYATLKPIFLMNKDTHVLSAMFTNTIQQTHKENNTLQSSQLHQEHEAGLTFGK
jgi:hypothetical protein